MSTLPPVPPVPSGPTLSSLPWRKILCFLSLSVIVGTCLAVTISNDTNEIVLGVPAGRTTSTTNQSTRSISPPPTRKPLIVTATPALTRKSSTYRSSGNRTYSPSPTAINEAEIKLWRAWPDHYDELAGLQEEMKANFNSIMADGIADANDLPIICTPISDWEQRLNPIAKFMRDYRATDPKTIEENSPLQNMEKAIEVAYEYISNSKALCN